MIAHRLEALRIIFVYRVYLVPNTSNQIRLYEGFLARSAKGAPHSWKFRARVWEGMPGFGWLCLR